MRYITKELIRLGGISFGLYAGCALAEIEYKGNLSLQSQLFTASAIHSADQSSNLSGSAEIELYRAFGSNDRSLVVTPFVRIDQHDEERTHVDLRELLYLQASDNWEFRIGLGQVFWGVAESRNIVDIINQTDLVEGLTTDAKLGQPMINLTSIRDWGDLSLFVLPGFRTRTFAGNDGRPRLPFTIDSSNPQYESSDEDRHIDLALRYSTVIDVWDVGLSYFSGTSRDPLLRRNANSETPLLTPFYYQVDQFGLDVQATLEDWLLKTEWIHRSGDEIENHIEAVTGFEYSFFGVADSNLDVGIVTEYLWDERDTQASLFQNDLLIGLRFALNDEQSTDALVGVIVDLDDDSTVLTLEAQRRLGDSFKLSVDATIWSNDNNETTSQLRNEDYLQLELGYFF